MKRFLTSGELEVFKNGKKLTFICIINTLTMAFSLANLFLILISLLQ